MSARATLATALACAALVTGCDADTAENGPEDKARSTVEVFLNECLRTQPIGAADLLTESTREAFIEAGGTLVACHEVLELGGVGPPPTEDELKTIFEEAAVTRASANGGFAAVTVETPDGLTSTVELEQVHGRWYVAAPVP